MQAHILLIVVVFMLATLSVGMSAPSRHCMGQTLKCNKLFKQAMLKMKRGSICGPNKVLLRCAEKIDIKDCPMEALAEWKYAAVTINKIYELLGICSEFHISQKVMNEVSQYRIPKLLQHADLTEMVYGGHPEVFTEKVKAGITACANTFFDVESKVTEHDICTGIKDFDLCYQEKYDPTNAFSKAYMHFVHETVVGHVAKIMKQDGVCTVPQ